jgi:HEPN domain-containing protein
MKNKLFKKASIEQMNSNSTVGGRYHTRYSYINGYYESAKELVKVALKEEVGTYKKDILFYPICFNYRHYLELFLKSLIIESEILYDKTNTLGYLKNGTFGKKVSGKLDNEHNLDNLLKLFVERLDLVSDEKFPQKIRNYIIEIHNMDTNGQRFRYDIDRKKNLSFPNEEKFDLQNISKIMEEVHKLLCACDMELDHYIEISNEMISEWKNSIGNCY